MSLYSLRKICLGWLLLLGLLAQASWLFAASPGTSGGLLLVEADTARDSALGGAGVVLTDDAGAIFSNPAALASLKQVNTLFTHQQGLAADTLENLNVAAPLPSFGVLGASLIYHDISPLNDAGGNVASVSANDKLGILTFAQSAEGVLYGLTYGVNLKFLNSTIDNFSANAFAADLGLFWQPMREVALGLSVTNLGTPLKLADVGDPLPTLITLGGKYNVLPESDTVENCFLTAEVQQTLEADTDYRVGGEYMYAGTLAVRLGYAYIPGGAEGLTLGLGIQAALGTSQLRFDYTYRFLTWVDNLDGAQLFTLGFNF